jgi:hypothetical protein
MVSRKQLYALASTCIAVFTAVTLGSCSASTYSAPAPQTSESGAPVAATAGSGSAIPEIVVTAPRSTSPRVAEETASRPSAKRRS